MRLSRDIERAASVEVAQERAQEAARYAQVMDEMEQGYRDKGLWDKALVDCDGDELRAYAKYTKLRVVALTGLITVRDDVQALDDEEVLARKEERQRREHEREEREAEERQRRLSKAAEIIAEAEAEARRKKIQPVVTAIAIVVVTALLIFAFVEFSEWPDMR